MKICLFTSTFLPQIGGAELVVHNLAKYLTKYGHDVTVLAPRNRRDKRKIETNYTVHWYQNPPRRVFWEQSLMLYLLFEKYRSKFDIVNVHKAYPCSYSAAKIKNILKVPVVITPHYF